MPQGVRPPILHQAPVVVLVDMPAQQRPIPARPLWPVIQLDGVVTHLGLRDYQQTLMPLGRLTGPMVPAAVVAAGPTLQVKLELPEVVLELMAKELLVLAASLDRVCLAVVVKVDQAVKMEASQAAISAAAVLVETQALVIAAAEMVL